MYGFPLVQGPGIYEAIVTPSGTLQPCVEYSNIDIHDYMEFLDFSATLTNLMEPSFHVL